MRRGVEVEDVEGCYLAIRRLHHSLLLGMGEVVGGIAEVVEFLEGLVSIVVERKEA